ncbi:MAG: hypothetical protein MI924_09445 [Chloroflexales bacterium]|nr:hypothetical protein [Chloroflexales bacterium]
MRKLIVICMAMIALAACGQPAPSVEPSPTGSTTTPAQSPDASTPTDVPTAETPAIDSSVSDDIVDIARASLTAYLGVSDDRLTLSDRQDQTWSDGSLGCPAPDRAYTQAIIEGYLIVFSDGQQNYPIHTSLDGNPLILCQDGAPTVLERADLINPAESTPQALPDGMQQMLDLAVERLAADQGVAEDDIAVITSEPATWNDSSLGCPQPGVDYLQVITEGYRFVLEVNVQQFEVHTDTDRSVVFCPNVLPGSTDGTR